jgi:hypothetical protein
VLSVEGVRQRRFLVDSLRPARRSLSRPKTRHEAQNVRACLTAVPSLEVHLEVTTTSPSPDQTQTMAKTMSSGTADQADS